MIIIDPQMILSDIFIAHAYDFNESCLYIQEMYKNKLLIIFLLRV